MFLISKKIIQTLLIKWLIRNTFVFYLLSSPLGVSSSRNDIHSGADATYNTKYGSMERIALTIKQQLDSN